MVLAISVAVAVWLTHRAAGRLRTHTNLSVRNAATVAYELPAWAAAEPTGYRVLAAVALLAGVTGAGWSYGSRAGRYSLAVIQFAVVVTGSSVRILGVYERLVSQPRLPWARPSLLLSEL